MSKSIHSTIVACVLLAAMSRQSPAQPNIIHIIADDMGWTDLSSSLTNLGNGSQFYQTPNIDRLAREGLSFTSAYAMPTCVPTRMAIMTGQAGARTRTYAAGSITGTDTDLLIAPENLKEIPNQTQTLGETMQSAGYNTAHIGKFHITRNAQSITAQHGFDVNIGGDGYGSPGSYFPTESNNQWTYPRNVSDEMDRFAEPYSASYLAESILPYSNGADADSLVGTPKHISDATADAAIDYIQGQVGSDAPFYMNLAFHAVHTPIEPRPDLLAKYQSILSENGGRSPDNRHDDAAYAAMLEGMDQAIGRLVSFLENPDGDAGTNDSLASNTLLVFYGDNGGGLRQTSNSPLQRGKGSLLEGGIRVPMIAYMPGTVAASTASNELIQATDFYPTFAELAEASLPNANSQPLDGVSFSGILAGEPLDRAAVHLHYPGYANGVEPSSVSISQAGDRQYKIGYQYADRSIEIFDLTADIEEQSNLAGADMDERTYKQGAKAIVGLREFLDSTNADYPQTRDGELVPPPSHFPTVEIQLGEESVANQLGIAVITESIDEGTRLTFNRDVMLKSLSFDRSSLAASDAVSLTFVEGDNPFLTLEGYGGEGNALTEDALTISGTLSEIATFNFGNLAQDEIVLTAGTTFVLTSSDPSAKPKLNSLFVAEPLASLNKLLLDASLDGELNAADIDRICSASRLDSSAIELDQNGDNVVSLADVEVWLTSTQHQSGDADLNGVVDFGDFLTLSQNFSSEATWSEGDFDCDGTVAFGDFLTLSTNFGQSFVAMDGSVNNITAVPEPTSQYGLAAALFALVLTLRRHCRDFGNLQLEWEG